MIKKFQMRAYLLRKFKGVERVKKIRAEASLRSFYRIHFPRYSVVAMVYPGAAEDEIQRISYLTSLYLQAGIAVPKILDIFDNRIVVQEDLGDDLAQRVFTKLGNRERERFLRQVGKILLLLKEIPIHHVSQTLDHPRLKWEMDFFLEHFAKNMMKNRYLNDSLRESLYRLVEKIADISFFAHRDFHSRNMLLMNDRLYLVDFQDSLVAPPLYDLVSFLFDAYLSMGDFSHLLLSQLKKGGLDIDDDQFWLTALQRNIKALGTFGHQIMVRKKLQYKKYIQRTIGHIGGNRLASDYFDPRIFQDLKKPIDNH